MKRFIIFACMVGGILSGEPEKFSFLYSVNNAGYIDVCGCKNKKVKQGGMARRYTLIKQFRSLEKPILLLDGGSSFFDIKNHTPKEFEKKQLLAKAFVIVESMNRMGYTAMALGSSDLSLGIDNLKKLEKSADFPILSANFFDQDNKVMFKPWTIVKVADVRIGIIGLIMSTLNPHYIERVAPGCSVKKIFPAAKKAVSELKDKVDFIVALSHAKKEENQELGDQVPEISIIFDPNINYGSHSLFINNPEDYFDRFNKALVIRSDGEGMRLTKVDIEFNAPFKEVRTSPELNRLEKGLHGETLSADFSAILGKGDFNCGALTRISIEPHHLPDPGLKELVDLWKTKDPGAIDPANLKELKGKELKYMLKESCVECHEKQYKFWLKTDHAKAFKTLKDMGDHLRYDCIGCHTVGFGHTFLHPKNGEKFGDVQCESCHGTNPEHVADPEKAPRWPAISEQTCLRCHNKHQIRIPFNYREKKPIVACPKMD